MCRRQQAQPDEVKQVHQQLAGGVALREHAVRTAVPWHGIALASARRVHTSKLAERSKKLA